jgi:Stress responsive A/B Barrel Domain
MRTWCFACAVAGLALAALLAMSSLPRSDARAQKSPQIAHMVYFSLKDGSQAEREKVVAACKKYLTKHPGEVYFSAGIIAKDVKSPVNDAEFDVGLHIVFEDMKAFEQYRDAPRHQDFIKEGQANWKKVRVFDTLVTP